MVIEQPERGLFFIDEFGDKAFQRWSDIDLSGIKAMLGFLTMASPLKSPENVKFCQDLKRKINEHPDQHELQSKKPKLEALGIKLN